MVKNFDNKNKREKELELKRKMNVAKTRLKIFYFILAVFFAITVFLLFSSAYICKGGVYEKIVDTTMGTEQYQYNQLFLVNDKITFVNLAFGLENKNGSNIVPVAKDSRFLFLYIGQLIAYGLLLLKFIKNEKVKFWTNLVASVVLLGVAITTILFIGGYQKDLQSIFDSSILSLTSINANITSITDSVYPSRIVVSLSMVPAISCAYMIVSSLLCLYVMFLEKFVLQHGGKK